VEKFDSYTRGGIKLDKEFKKEVSKMAETKKYTKDSIIGDVLKKNPEAIKIIEKYFGQGCFTCPGMKVESISFGAMMHNIDPETIVKELNELGE
jgi:hybrid cluster-associated redox disulfide protein